MKKLFWLFALLALIWPLSAQETPEETAQLEKELKTFLDGLHYEQGTVVLKDGLATVNVPPDFRFLGPDDAEKVLVQLWGNPPGDKPLGMLIPSKFSPASDDGWAAVLTYEEDGFIKDDDASKIKYGELLKQMQKATSESNAERKKQGYGTIELIGWAAPPSYDAVAKKLYWAKELQFDGSPEHTLNYDIRVLGRRGVLSLNCVAGMNLLPEIQASAPHLLEMVSFNERHRYADFNPNSDKIAEYGLAALVAGGVAAKAGFFKAALVALLAAKKFLIVGAVALVAALKKMFGKKE